MSSWLSFRMARRHLRAAGGRIVLSVVAVGLGVALVVAIRVMSVAVLQSFTESVDALAGRAALMVTASDRGTFDEGVVETVARVPGVSLAVPLVRAVTFPADDSGELLTVHGIDITNDGMVRVYHRDDAQPVIEDTVEFLNQPNSILVGREFADARQLVVGSTLSLVTPSGTKPFVVRGVLDPQGLAKTLRGRLVVMDLFAAEAAFTAPRQLNQIDVLVERGAEGRVRSALEAALPAGLRVEEPVLRKIVFRDTVSGMEAILTAFAMLAVGAGLVICYSRLGAIFEARAWQIGVLRSVGMRQGVLFAELLKESLLIGLLGVLVGVPAGIVLATVGLPILTKTLALNYGMPVVASDTSVTPGSLLVGVGVGLAAAAVAAALPALRLARRHPVAALRMRGRDSTEQRAGTSWQLPAGFLLAAGAAILAQRVAGGSALGHVTTALLALAACVIAVPLLQASGALLERVWRLVGSPTGVFTSRQLARQPRRPALTVAALGIGLGTILMFGMLSASLQHTLVDQIGSRVKADLVVASQFVAGGWQSAPLDEGILEELRHVTGVAAVAGEQRRDIVFGGETIALYAYDRDSFENPRLFQWPSDGPSDFAAAVGRGEGAMISDRLARRFALGVGQTITLDTPHGPRELRILGVTNSQPEPAVIVARELYRTGWNDPKITWAHLTVKDGVAPDAVKQHVEQRLGAERRIQVQLGQQFVAYFGKQVQQAFGVLYLLEIVILALVMIGTGDSLAAAVLERNREFGVMRAVGLRRSGLFRLVLLEGSLITLNGLALALGLGLLLGLFWVHLQFPAMLGWTLHVHFPYAFALYTVVLAFVVTTAGAFLPSLRAASLSVAKALRSE